MILQFITSLFLITDICAYNATQESFLLSQVIEREHNLIAATPESEYEMLTDLYASRGESFLICGRDEEALEDFQLAYHYAQSCTNYNEVMEASFRALLGTFLVAARAENLPVVQYLREQLKGILQDLSCEDCYERVRVRRERLLLIETASTHIQLASNPQPDWPILGPERVSIRECLARVEATTDALFTLLAVIKKAEVKALAILTINSLADQAARCCYAGGLWKGCLQKMVNKLHYWKVLGVPADPAWDD